MINKEKVKDYLEIFKNNLDFVIFGFILGFILGFTIGGNGFTAIYRNPIKTVESIENIKLLE
jgi:hypothetical protein